MSEVKFDISEKLIFLNIGIASINSDWVFYLPVVLDTGASTTILPADILVDLGYNPGNPNLPKMRIITGSGVEYAPVIKVATIFIGSDCVYDIDVLCHDLPAEAGIDGLLGMNVLKPFDVDIHHSTEILTFRKFVSPQD